MRKLLLIDDHKIILDGIKALLDDKQQDMHIFEALTGTDGLAIARQEAVDIVLLDINLPDKSGFEVCKELKNEQLAPKIIALTMHGESAYISKMVKAGVDGYILKNTGKAEILKAIETVLSGNKYFSQEVTLNLAGGRSGSRPRRNSLIQKLTRREKEILHLIIEELTTDEIAQRLFISSTTVISHRKNLLRKLNAKNTAGLVRAAYEFGLLED